AVDVERLDPLRHDRDRGDPTAVRDHAHAIARGDAELGRELLADLDELLGLHDRVEPHVLRPEMEMLRETVRRRDVRELCRVTELAPVAFEDARGRVADRATLV